MSRLFSTIDPDSTVDFPRGEISTQANVDATYAATLWEQHVKPLVNTGITFIAPSVTLSPHGLDWLKTFMAACNDCPVRFYVDSRRLFLMNNL